MNGCVRASVKKEEDSEERREVVSRAVDYMLSGLEIPPSFLPPLLPPSAGGLFVADHARILSVLRESPLLLGQFCSSRSVAH